MKKFLCMLFVSMTFMLVASVISSAALPAPISTTFVSGVGDDANPCTRSAPCATFAGALAKTAVNGQINVLDPGSFGAVTITQSVTIDGGGNFAGIQVTAGDAIDINGGAAVVVLRGLTLDGQGTANSGISITLAPSVLLENCTISNFTVNGIDDAASSPVNSILTVKNSTVQNNQATGAGGIGGVYLHPAGAGLRAYFDNVLIANNAVGFRADDQSDVSIHNCQIVSNNKTGVIAMSTAIASTIIIDNTQVSHNLASGITSTGSVSSIVISNVTCTRNGAFGIRATNSATLYSFGNNSVAQNGTDGSPTLVISPR